MMNRPASPRSGERARTRRPSLLRPTLEALEDRITPAGVGWAITADPAGTVFVDANVNGKFDAGETGLAGWTVWLDINRDSVLSPGEPVTTTDANGFYMFDTTNVPPAFTAPDGSLCDVVHVDLPDTPGGHWLNTNSTGVWINRTATPVALGVDFGVTFQPFVGVAPTGPESLANVAAAGQQGNTNRVGGGPVSIAADTAGNYVVAWRTHVVGGTDTISARVFNADGSPRTGELVVGTAISQVITGDDGVARAYGQMPQVSMSGDGRFTVAWSSLTGIYNMGTNTTSTFMRVYLGDGTPVTGTVAVSTGTSTSTAAPYSTAMDAVGDILVMYGKATYSKGNGWSNASTMIQRYTKTGAANGSVINVGTPYLIGGARSLAMDATGNFVAVWDDAIISSGKTSVITNYIYAQRYNASGKPNGSLITVASLADQPNMVLASSVGMAHDGRFMIAWEHQVIHYNPDGSVYYDYIGNAQAFTSGGSRTGTVLEVTRSNGVVAPLGIAYDDAGNVTFTFTDQRYRNPSSLPPYDDGEVRYRRLNAAGVFEPEMIANTTTQGAQFSPGIAVTGSGSFVIAWQGYGPGDDAGIFSQRFSTAPYIGSFTASPNLVTLGTPVTLTATGVQALAPGSTITQVAIYVDSNGDGVLEPGTDTLLGYGTLTSAGTWTFSFTFSTSGTYKLFVQAKDSFGAFSDPLSLDLTVQ
jgi:hypothetical protein